ncbi:alpha/beta fold hydrolase [Microbacterium gorillae]|uniref:alpha/beta fold hydrolase n=1 Tax=Microbacterium gorillae TaxID=1231063 RepID=UPI00058DF796|nr:alpha/beta hydrolase [Microbacterium gorillae]
MSFELHRVEHGTGKPAIFIHGFTVDHHLLLPLESAFADRHGWRRIYLDLPGHGRTPAGCPATADAVADAVSDTIAEVLGDDVPFAVCGNSFGGQIAREMVARYRDRVLGLALIAPLVQPRSRRRRGVRRTFPSDAPAVDLTNEDRERVAEFTDTAVEHTAVAWANFTRYVAPGLSAHDRGFATRLLEKFDLAVAPEDRFTTFDRPGLMVTGRQDDGVGYEDQFDLLSSYPRMTYVALDRAGHNVHLDQPEITRALVGEWLDKMA